MGKGSAEQAFRAEPGSVIDCCKVVSSQAVPEEDIWDMEYGRGKFPTAGIPVGAVVTAPVLVWK